MYPKCRVLLHLCSCFSILPYQFLTNIIFHPVFVAGEGDITRKLVEPIKVFSEKDLLREIEKVVSTLQPDNEWSIRITAMQRVEGLVLGGS